MVNSKFLLIFLRDQLLFSVASVATFLVLTLVTPSLTLCPPVTP